MLQSYTDAADVLEDEDELLVVIHKPCISCTLVKPLSDYYAHSRMGDGHLNKCKECCKRDNSKNREEKAEYYQEYERNRGSEPHRVAARKAYSLTDHGKAVIRELKVRYAKRPEVRAKVIIKQRESRIVNAKKHYAREQVAYAIKTGRMFRPELCEDCGLPHPNIQAHHQNYNYPLDIEWLCKPCHVGWHMFNEPEC